MTNLDMLRADDVDGRPTRYRVVVLTVSKGEQTYLDKVSTTSR